MIDEEQRLTVKPLKGKFRTLVLIPRGIRYWGGNDKACICDHVTKGAIGAADKLLGG